VTSTKIKANAQPRKLSGLSAGERSTPKAFASGAPNHRRTGQAVQGPTRTDIKHQTSNIPIALTIAGSDSSAGAGVQADLKTFSAFKVYGVSAITCVVAETPGKVSRIDPVSSEMVREQIEVLVSNFPIAAIKTGLLGSSEIISAVARAMRDRSIDILFARGRIRPLAATRSWKPARPIARRALPPDQAIPLVIDPVMVATSGDQLLQPEAIQLYEKELFPLATLITPNLDEAAKLLDRKIEDRQSMQSAVRALANKYGVPILLKGGHLPGNRAIDLLFHGGKITEFSAPFVRGVATHGTGCAYSAAITAGLASGLRLEHSIRRAKKFVTTSIRNHLRWKSHSGAAIHALNYSGGTVNA
jgi:hydroxymethylpyrimidine/phosphomethylpyrimidine kinase